MTLTYMAAKVRETLRDSSYNSEVLAEEIEAEPKLIAPLRSGDKPLAL